MRTKACYLYGKFDWEVYAETVNSYQFLALLWMDKTNPW